MSHFLQRQEAFAWLDKTIQSFREHFPLSEEEKQEIVMSGQHFHSSSCFQNGCHLLPNRYERCDKCKRMFNYEAEGRHELCGTCCKKTRPALRMVYEYSEEFFRDAYCK